MISGLLILLAVSLLIIYKWSTANFDYFEKRNIPYTKPFPILGIQKDIVLKKLSFMDKLLQLYNSFNYTSVFGVFDQRVPLYGIRSRTLMKHIMVKDFDHFVNHRSDASEVFGGIANSTVFVMKNEKWKNMRTTLVPMFKGNNLRLMFQHMDKIAFKAVEFLKNTQSPATLNDFKIRDFFQRYSNDTIASTMYGIEIDSFNDETNKFYTMIRKLTKYSTFQNTRFFLFTNFKPVMKFFKLNVFDQKDLDYFENLVYDEMKNRQENKIIRHDMVNMMLETKGIFINEENQKHKPTNNLEWTDKEIAAQFFATIFAGIEATAILLSFVVMELVDNPDCQERLHQEIIQAKRNLNGKPLSFDVLLSMRYMDMVLSETLRRWPPVTFFDRECTKDFFYKDETVEAHFRPGENILIPIVGHHLDERYHPDPLKFNPERFSDENKDKIKPFTYMPFGTGPRYCMGGKYALIKAKTMLFYLLSEFQLEASSKSSRPIELMPDGLNLEIKNGFWVKLVPFSNIS